MSYERNLCSIRECHVFKIGPRPSADGYVAERWHENEIWCGRCRVVEIGDQCSIRLEDPSSDRLFAKCTVGDNAVERVLDSSRYFVLRIERGTKHAFIGIGFQERAEAFDFKAALERHDRNLDAEGAARELASIPTHDYRMQDGARIRVNLKVKTKDEVHESHGLRGAATATGKSSSSSSGSLFDLGPPPSASSTSTASSSSSSSTSSSSASVTSTSSRRRRKRKKPQQQQQQQQPKRPQQGQVAAAADTSAGSPSAFDWGDDDDLFGGGKGGAGGSAGSGGSGDDVLLQF